MERAVEQSHLHVLHGVPARTPFRIASMIPSETGLMYSRGIDPPTMAFSNSYPFPFRSVRPRSRRGRTAAAARLADKLALDLHLLADGFLVGDLRLADVRLDAEFALHPVDDDFQVQLAHAADDRLPSLLVRGDAERGVLVGELHERFPDLLLVGLGLRLDGDSDDRLRELHFFEDDRVRLVAQRIAGLGGFEPDHGDDIAA